MPATSFFTVLFSIVVLSTHGYTCLFSEITVATAPVRCIKKALVVNLLLPGALYFGALHFHPGMGTPRFAAYTAVYLGCMLIRSWQVVKGSR